MLSYEAARQKIIEVAKARFHARAPETIDISRATGAAIGRVLAEDIPADRNYPAFDRAIRDGYAVPSADLATVPARLKLIGEAKAGTAFGGAVGPGECVQIMTG